MKRELSSYRVVILGDEYAVISDESEEHVMESANYVHTLLQESMRKAPITSSKKIATLTALRLASTLIITEEAVKKYEERSNALVHYIDRLIWNVTSGQ
jgi:cell division protein ZapA (FtsZ GTPase activity inhibitor)